MGYGYNPRYLNSLVLTIAAKDETFKQKLLALIATLQLKEVAKSDNTFHYKLNYIDEILQAYNADNAKIVQDRYKPLGKDFFKLTFNDDNTCIVSLDGIVDVREFNPKPKIIGDIKDVMSNFKIMFSDPLTTSRLKQHIVKEILDLVRNEGLYGLAKIDQLSFLNIFSDPTVYNVIKGFLINDDISEEELKNDYFTSEIKGYEAKINAPQNIVNSYFKKLNQDSIFLKQLNEAEAIVMLKKAIKATKKFNSLKLLEIRKEDGNFFLQADVSCRKVWNKPVDIYDEELLFYPIFWDVSNYYGLKELMQERHFVSLSNSGEEQKDDKWTVDHELIYEAIHKKNKETLYYMKIDSTTLLTKEKMALILVMNDLISTDKVTMQKYGETEQYSFTLAADVGDLVKHIADVPFKFAKDARKDCRTYLPLDAISNELKYYFGQ